MPERSLSCGSGDSGALQRSATFRSALFPALFGRGAKRAAQVSNQIVVQIHIGDTSDVIGPKDGWVHVFFSWILWSSETTSRTR